MPASVIPIGTKGSRSAHRAASWATFEVAQPGRVPVPYGILLADNETGECGVFYFGPGQGGGVQANVDRWIGQFQQPNGKPSKDVAHMGKKTIHGFNVTTVDVTGTYMGMGGPMSPTHSGSVTATALSTSQTLGTATTQFLGSVTTSQTPALAASGSGDALAQPDHLPPLLGPQGAADLAGGRPRPLPGRQSARR